SMRASIMRFTALPPPPPTPMTLILALLRCSSLNWMRTSLSLIVFSFIELSSYKFFEWRWLQFSFDWKKRKTIFHRGDTETRRKKIFRLELRMQTCFFIPEFLTGLCASAPPRFDYMEARAKNDFSFPARPASSFLRA